MPNNKAIPYMNSAVEESFRVLRSNIQFCGFDHSIKSLTITSCKPGEGKTTTAVKLAVSMAKAGLKVMLVDADMRKSLNSKVIGEPSSPGLSSVISGHASLEEATIYTNVEGLSYICCGPKPPNPAELISSSRFSDFLQKAVERYDMVIFDSPPLGIVIDGAIIASKTQGTLLVVQPRANDTKAIQRVKQQLEKANASILGVVLNKVKKSEYKNYYSFHKYYLKKNDRVKSFDTLKVNSAEKAEV